MPHHSFPVLSLLMLSQPCLFCFTLYIAYILYFSSCCGNRRQAYRNVMYSASLRTATCCPSFVFTALWSFLFYSTVHELQRWGKRWMMKYSKMMLPPKEIGRHLVGHSSLCHLCLFIVNSVNGFITKGQQFPHCSAVISTGSAFLTLPGPLTSFSTLLLTFLKGLHC